MKSSSSLAVAILAGLSFSVMAQTPSPNRADQRQAEQQKRIEQGVQSGELTKREAARLEKGQEHVQKMENKAMADGKVTGKEARRIEHAQDVQSRRIAGQKHDRQHRK